MKNNNVNKMLRNYNGSHKYNTLLLLSLLNMKNKKKNVNNFIKINLNFKQSFNKLITQIIINM